MFQIPYNIVIHKITKGFLTQPIDKRIQMLTFTKPFIANVVPMNIAFGQLHVNISIIKLFFCMEV